MESLRARLGISWEPLTRLYRNISQESSSLSGRLEGDTLGDTVKEISAARDELYAERAKDKATLADIAELVKKRPERYPSLSGLLQESQEGDASVPPEKQLMKDLEKHLVREGLIRTTKGVSFTHRVSKFLVSDVDERILRRVYDALQGVSYEELPPLPSSDVKDVRKYQRGDSYKDIAVRESIRDAIRRSKKAVDRENLHVYERQPERREVAVQGDADVVVVLDLSGSMAYGDKLWYAKQAIVVMTIIAERYGNRVGVVGFRDLSTEVAELGADRNTSISKVANLLPRGGTNIAAGIRRAIDLLVGELDVRKGERLDTHLHPERRKHLILLTDGDATHPKPKQFAGEYARRCARLAARHDIVISVVCIGSEDDSSEYGRSYNPELAEQLSEIGGGSLFFVRDMRDLSAVFVAEIDRLMFQESATSPLPIAST
jgi:Mg-chelatase subunit ChlD